MPPTPRRLAELEEMIAAAERSVTSLTAVVERRTAIGKDTTNLRKLVQSTQARLAALIERRKRLLDDEASE
jgi:uncharacterized coiled-coil protein SlyX